MHLKILTTAELQRVCSDLCTDKKNWCDKTKELAKILRRFEFDSPDWAVVTDLKELISVEIFSRIRDKQMIFVDQDDVKNLMGDMHQQTGWSDTSYRIAEFVGENTELGL